MKTLLPAGTEIDLAQLESETSTEFVAELKKKYEYSDISDDDRELIVTIKKISVIRDSVRVLTVRILYYIGEHCTCVTEWRFLKRYGKFEMDFDMAKYKMAELLQWIDLQK